MSAASVAGIQVMIRGDRHVHIRHIGQRIYWNIARFWRRLRHARDHFAEAARRGAGPQARVNSETALSGLRSRNYRFIGIGVAAFRFVVAACFG